MRFTPVTVATETPKAMQREPPDEAETGGGIEIELPSVCGCGSKAASTKKA